MRIVKYKVYLLGLRRKVIWAILALQLLLRHLLFLENNTHLDYFVNRVVGHFGLSYHLYFHWKKLAILIWLISAVFVMALHHWNYIRFRRYCINRLSIVLEADIRENLEAAVLETGLHGGKSDRSFLYRSSEVTDMNVTICGIGICSINYLCCSCSHFYGFSRLFIC